MSKPISPLNTFESLSPPWSLVQLDSNFNTLSAAINDIGTYSTVIQDTGTVNALVLTLPAGLTFSLTTGVGLYVQAANTNTSTTVTMNVSGTGAKAVVDDNGNLPSLGAIQATAIYLFVYDGTSWRCMNPSVGSMLTAAKQATTPRSATTILNDPDLVASIATSGYYDVYVQCWPWSGTTAGSAFSWGLNYSGTYDHNSAISIISSSPTITGTGVINPTVNTSFGIGGQVGVAQYTLSIITTGVLMATGPGILGFSWASANAIVTNLGKGSYMRVTRML